MARRGKLEQEIAAVDALRREPDAGRLAAELSVVIVGSLDAWLNQMGAEFTDILPLWQQLWLCAALYGCTAWWLLRRQHRLS